MSVSPAFLAAELILKYIKDNDHVSFAEVERELEKAGYVEKSAEGTYPAVMSSKWDKVILWISDNRLVIAAVTELLDRKRILMEPCAPLVYFAGGQVLNLPIVKRLCDHKTDHWFPVVLRLRK